MTEFLSQITTFFNTLLVVVKNFFTGIVYVFTLIPQALAYFGAVSMYIPAFILAFAMLIALICVVYLIVGR